MLHVGRTYSRYVATRAPWRRLASASAVVVHPHEWAPRMQTEIITDASRVETAHQLKKSASVVARNIKHNLPQPQTPNLASSTQQDENGIRLSSFQRNRAIARTRRNRLPLENWHKTLDLLINNVSENPQHYAYQSIIVRLNGPKNPNIDDARLGLMINLQFNCTIKFSQAGNDKAGELLLVIRGLEQNVQRALNSLRGSFQDVRHVQAEATARILARSSYKLHRFISNPRAALSIRKSRMLSEIQVPKTMNMISFANYVQDVTASMPSRVKIHIFRGKHADVARSKTHHVHQVSEVLLTLFDVKRLAPCWSSAAIVMALQYLVKNLQIPQARALIMRLQRSNAIVSPAVYEAMLEGQAKTEHLRSFDFCLRMMIDQGHKPTARSWILFIRLLRYWKVDAAEEVVQHMKNLGMLKDISVRLQVLDELIYFRYSRWMESGRDTASFLDKIYAENEDFKHLPDAAVQHMLAWHIYKLDLAGMEYIMSRETQVKSYNRINPHMIATVLKQAFKARDVTFAYEGLRLLEKANHGHLPKLTENAFEILSNLAHRTQGLNLNRVAWQYACMNSSVNYTLMARVRAGLKQSASGRTSLTYMTARWPQLLESQPENSQTALEPHHASKGRNPARQPRRRLVGEIFDHVASTLAIGIGYKPSSRPAAKSPDGHASFEVDHRKQSGTSPSQSTARATMQSRSERLGTMKLDMNEGNRYRPLVPFLDMMELAMREDEILRNQPLKGNTFDRVWKMMLPIPVRPRFVKRTPLFPKAEAVHDKASV